MNNTRFSQSFIRPPLAKWNCNNSVHRKEKQMFDGLQTVFTAILYIPIQQKTRPFDWVMFSLLKKKTKKQNGNIFFFPICNFLRLSRWMCWGYIFPYTLQLYSVHAVKCVSSYNLSKPTKNQLVDHLLIRRFQCKLIVSFLLSNCIPLL